MTKLIFQDFPWPRESREKILGLSKKWEKSCRFFTLTFLAPKRLGKLVWSDNHLMYYSDGCIIDYSLQVWLSIETYPVMQLQMPCWHTEFITRHLGCWFRQGVFSEPRRPGIQISIIQLQLLQQLLLILQLVSGIMPWLPQCPPSVNFDLLENCQ